MFAERPRFSSVDDELTLPRTQLVGLVVIGLVRAGATAAGILLIRRVIDAVNEGARPTTALPDVAWFLLASLVIAVARGFEYSIAERVGYAQVARVREVLHDHLLNLPVHKVQRSSQGAILLRFMGDLSTLRTWTSRGLARGVAAGFTLLFGLAAVVIIDWVIGAAVIGVLLLGSAASILWGYQVHRATRAVRWRRSLLASNVAEQVRSLSTIQAFGRSNGERSRLHRQNLDLLGALGRAADARGALRFVSAAGSQLAIGAVLVCGVYLLEREQVTVGGVVAAMTSIRLLTGPLQTIGRSHEYWQAARVSRTKLGDFLRRPPRVADDAELPPLRVRKGRIEFRDVGLEGILHNIDLVVEGRSITAVMGHNGAGKSTLLALLTRAIEPTSGSIVVDGQNLAEHSTRSTVRNIGVVSPDLPLMRGTIRRNLTYRRGRATDEDLMPVVYACGIDEVLARTDGGLDAWVVEGGTNLATGHRQRIALGRAALGNPRILLLDEPTTGLDAASAAILRDFVWRYDGTVIIVTHDPADAALADQVILLDSGCVVATSSGDEFSHQTTHERVLVS